MTIVGREFVLRAADGTPLQCACWPASQPRAALLLAHGVASHLRWYAPLAEALADTGITVLIADRRGCGRSGGRRGDAPSTAVLLDDMRLAAAALRERTSGVPQHVGGVSLGALLAAAALLEEPAAWSSLVLITPALQLATPLTRWQQLQLTVAGAITPTLSFRMPYGSNAIARTADWQAALDADPLRITRITARFGRITQRLQSNLLLRASEVHAPILLQLAGADRVVDNATSHNFYSHCSSTIRRVETYDDAPHGLPLSVARGRLEAQLSNWMLVESQRPAANAACAANDQRFARDDTALLRRPAP